MTSTTGNWPTRSDSGRRARRGFTLIELILVLAIFATVLAVAAPSLAVFFRGRHLDSESRRLLALTRYGQSRAVAEGIPIELWFDLKQGLYGLEAEAGYLNDDDKAVEFSVADDLTLEPQSPQLASLAAVPQAGLTARRTPDQLHSIFFEPDGFVREGSPEWVLVHQERDDALVCLARSRNRLNYEIATNLAEVLRR